MYRRSISRNDRPYDAKVKDLINSLVDEIKEKLLRPLADATGALPSGLIPVAFRIFQQGKEIRLIGRDLEVLFPPFSDEVVSQWKKFFETSTIEEMFALGVPAVEWGWSIVNHNVRRWIVSEKLSKVYVSDDPMEWWKAAGVHADLSNGRAHPFWSPEQVMEIRERVGAVMSTVLSPAPPAGMR